MSKIITIGREFGSGGHVAGQLIADQLSIPYYDNELTSLTVRFTNSSAIALISAILF